MGRKIYALLSKRWEEESNAHHLNQELGDDGIFYAANVLRCVSVNSARYKSLVNMESMLLGHSLLCMTYYEIGECLSYTRGI